MPGGVPGGASGIERRPPAAVDMKSVRCGPTATARTSDSIGTERTRVRVDASSRRSADGSSEPATRTASSRVSARHGDAAPPGGSDAAYVRDGWYEWSTS